MSTLTTNLGYLKMNYAANDAARVILNRTLNQNDIDISVRRTVWGVLTSGFRWEVKAGKFNDAKASSTERAVNGLKEGFLAFVQGKNNRTGIAVMNWKMQAGATSSSGFVALSSYPNKLQIKREATKITVLADGTAITTNTNAAWNTLSTLKPSFAVDSTTDSGTAGFNAFNVVNKALSSYCLGTDGQGSQAVSSPNRIAGVFRLAEITGPEESMNLKQREAHTYFRPPVGLTSLHQAFEVDWYSYKDGGTIPEEMVTAIKHQGDIQNWRNIEAHRIQHEIRPNISMWRLVGADAKYWAEEKKDTVNGPDGTEEATWQDELANDMKYWFGRGDYTLNRATGDAVTVIGTITEVTGPDGKSEGGIKMSSRTMLVSLDGADTDTATSLGSGHADAAAALAAADDLTDYTGAALNPGYGLHEFAISNKVDGQQIVGINMESHHACIDSYESGGFYINDREVDVAWWDEDLNSWLTTGTFPDGLADFTIGIWINDYCPIDSIIHLIGENDFEVYFGGPTLLYVGTAGITIPTIDDGRWHFIEVKRASNVISTKVDNVLYNTTVDATEYGGIGMFVRSDGAHVGDVRVYSKAVSDNAMTYYYDNVRNNHGDKVCPT